MGEEADYLIDNELAEQWHGGQDYPQHEKLTLQEQLNKEFQEGGKYASKIRE